jgi:hypothetical protein
MKMIYFIVTPTIIVWLILFPLLIFILLRRNKHNFNTPDFIIKYGMFFIGLKDNSFFWEIIIVNARKVLCSAIHSSMTSQN